MSLNRRRSLALNELRDELLRIGFYVERPRGSAETLTVYPLARHVYPLLRIGYRSKVPSDTGYPRAAATLVASVISKGLKGIATRLLGFKPSRDCWFEHVGAKLAGDYRQHGRFIILVESQADALIVPTKALERIHKCLVD